MEEKDKIKVEGIGKVTLKEDPKEEPVKILQVFSGTFEDGKIEFDHQEFLDDSMLNYEDGVRPGELDRMFSDILAEVKQDLHKHYKAEAKKAQRAFYVTGALTLLISLVMLTTQSLLLMSVGGFLLFFMGKQWLADAKAYDEAKTKLDSFEAQYKEVK